jgi:hypothetical protein
MGKFLRYYNIAIQLKSKLETNIKINAIVIIVINMTFTLGAYYICIFMSIQ